RGRGDARDLGVRCSGARVDGVDVWDQVQLVEGFWGDEPMPADEPGGQWTSATARLRVPALASRPRVELRLAADAPTSGEAESVVRHVHSATATNRSPLTAHYNERNRLLVATRHASPSRAARSVGRYLAITGSYARRDIVAPVLRGEPARTEITSRRLRAFG